MVENKEFPEKLKKRKGPKTPNGWSPRELGKVEERVKIGGSCDLIGRSVLYIRG